VATLLARYTVTLAIARRAGRLRFEYARQGVTLSLLRHADRGNCPGARAHPDYPLTASIFRCRSWHSIPCPEKPHDPGARAYLEQADITDPKAPLFQTLDKRHRLTGQGMSRRDLLRAVKQRCAAAGLPETICNHTFRGPASTVFLPDGSSPLLFTITVLYPLG
jgi:hypothetical protein